MFSLKKGERISKEIENMIYNLVICLMFVMIFAKTDKISSDSIRLLPTSIKEIWQVFCRQNVI